MGYSDAAPCGAGRVFTNADLLTPEGLHGAVGAQNLEPWLDLSSQGSVEMTLVATPRPRPMTIPSNTHGHVGPPPPNSLYPPDTPPNTHGAAMGYSDAAPYGAGREFTNADF